jgi:hypothetical protein
VIDLLGALAAGALAAGFTCTALALSRLLTTARLASRAVAAAVLLCAAPVVAFRLLDAAGLFGLGGGIAVAVLLALIANRTAAGGGAFRAAARACRRSLRLRPSTLTLAVLAGAFCVPLIRLARGLVAPPLGWDALNYHLTRAAWLAADPTGGTSRFPDILGAYQYFPDVGSVLWAWLLLPFRSDHLIAAGGLFLWAFGTAATLLLARQLGANRSAALLCAAAAGALPCATAFVASGYVDNLTWASATAGAAFAALYVRTRDEKAMLLSAVSLAIAAGTKAIALPALVAAAACWLATPPRAPRRSAWSLRGAALLACAAIAAPPYARAFRDFGNPLYPLGLRIGPKTILAGNSALEREVRGRPSDGVIAATPQSTAAALFLPDVNPARRRSADFLNPGPGMVCLLLLAGSGLVRDTRPGATLVAAAIAVLVCAGVVTQPAFLGPWIYIAGRFFLPVASVVAGLAALAPAVWVRAGAVVSVAGSLIASFPLSYLANVYSVAALAAGALLLAAVAGTMIVVSRRGASHAWLLGTAGAVAITLAWSSARQRLRYVIYRQAADLRVFEVTTLAADAARAWHAWQTLDGAAPKTISLVSGWSEEAKGFTWYPYPFFGSRLQNSVVYVPPTEDGVVRDLALRDAGKPPNRDAWIERLGRRGVTHVVSLQPPGIEEGWMLGSPLFHEVAIPGAGPRVFGFGGRP